MRAKTYRQWAAPAPILPLSRDAVWVESVWWAGWGIDLRTVRLQRRHARKEARRKARKAARV